MFSVEKKARGAVRRARSFGRAARNQVILPWRTFEAEKSIQRFTPPYSLNVGCGYIKFDGWINLDSIRTDVADIVWDIRDGLPFADGSCRFIYNEHFLEHLDADDGASFLRECHRILRPEGVLRIAMPSLDVIIEKASQGTWRDQDWLTWPENSFINSRAEMLNVAFRWWGHLWLYDREELRRRLSDAGFSKIADAAWGRSEVAELSGRETRADSLLICEARR